MHIGKNFRFIIILHFRFIVMDLEEIKKNLKQIQNQINDNLKINPSKQTLISNNIP